MVRKLVVVLLSGIIYLSLTVTSALAVKYNEAPMLKVKVAAGELPRIEQRLPEEPLVLPVRDEIGKYGGTLNTAGTRTAPLFGGYSMGNYIGASLLAFAWGLRAELETIVPNIAKDFEFNKDMTKFTFYLRKGMKWSDGHPFTTEDIVFYWNHVLKNDELSPGKPKPFKNKDLSLIELKVIDDYTFQFTIKEPNPMFLRAMASRELCPLCAYPKHYFGQFHPDFADEKDLKALVKKEGFENWTQLFTAKVGDIQTQKGNPEKPALTPWIPKRMPPDLPPWVWERNPYYWAVDSAGNQLPYIDRWQHTKVELEVKNMRALSGESDATCALPFDLLGELKKSEKEGKIKIVLAAVPLNAQRMLWFNHTSNDPVLRQIFRDKRFKIAVSHAINQEEISQLLYMGMLEPQQSMPPKSRVYEATKYLAKKYTEYDPEKANRLLDEVGLDKRDSKGYRLRPDGKPLFLSITTYQQAWAADIELVASHLREVGLNAQLKLLDGSFWGPGWSNNELDVAMMAGIPVNPDLVTNRSFVFLVNSTWGSFAPLYAQWYASDGERGEKPTGEFMRGLEIWEQLCIEPDPEKQLELQKEIIAISVDNLWRIGILEPAPEVIAFNPDLKNIPPVEAIMCWDNISLDVYRPETYFFAE